MTLKFDGSSGRRPSAEARRYVLAVVATSIDNDLGDREGWLLGGLEEEPDRRRVRNEAKKMIARLQREAKR